jgi:hypothetical protein
VSAQRMSTSLPTLACLGGSVVVLSLVGRGNRAARPEVLTARATAAPPHGEMPLFLARVVTAAGAPRVAVGTVTSALIVRSGADRTGQGGPHARSGPGPGHPFLPDRDGLGRSLWQVAVLLSGLAVRRVVNEVVRRRRSPAEGWWTVPHGHSFPSKACDGQCPVGSGRRAAAVRRGGTR